MHPMKIQTLRCEIGRSKNPNGKLVVVLHGRGDSSAGFHWMPRTMALEGVSWLLVNAPDPWYGGFSWYRALDLYNHSELSHELLKCNSMVNPMHSDTVD